jgi:hypothetical protein
MHVKKQSSNELKVKQIVAKLAWSETEGARRVNYYECEAVGQGSSGSIHFTNNPPPPLLHICP